MFAVLLKITGKISLNKMSFTLSELVTLIKLVEKEGVELLVQITFEVKQISDLQLLF